MVVALEYDNAWGEIEDSATGRWRGDMDLEGPEPEAVVSRTNGTELATRPSARADEETEYAVLDKRMQFRQILVSMRGGSYKAASLTAYVEHFCAV